MNWYDKAVNRLEIDLGNGEISEKDFDLEMRELNAEFQQCAQDAAEQAYKDYTGY